MRAKWMGVAVAAVMACGLAGGVQRAEAAFLSISGTGYGQYGAPLGLSFVVSDDGLPDGVGGVRDAAYDSTNIYGTYISQFTSDQVSLQYHNYESSGNDYIGLYFNLYSGLYRETYTGNPTYGRPAYDFTTYIGPTPRQIYYTLYGSEIIGTHDALFYGMYVGTITISVVPLPSTAPLFGAALLALGGLGYARRRGKMMTA